MATAIQAIEQLLHDASTLNLSDLQSSLLNVVQNFNVAAFLQDPVGYTQQIVESLVGNFNVLSDLYYGFGGDHLFELLQNPVGFVQHIISNFLANPLGVLSNPFLLVLSADDYPTIFYPLISPFIAPAPRDRLRRICRRLRGAGRNSGGHCPPSFRRWRRLRLCPLRCRSSGWHRQSLRRP